MSDIETPDTIDDLRDQIIAAQDRVPEEADTQEAVELTIADVAAAAFVSIETLAQMLPPQQAELMIAEYNRRSADFRAEAE